MRCLERRPIRGRLLADLELVRVQCARVMRRAILDIAVEHPSSKVRHADCCVKSAQLSFSHDSPLLEALSHD